MDGDQDKNEEEDEDEEGFREKGEEIDRDQDEDEAEEASSEILEYAKLKLHGHLVSFIMTSPITTIAKVSMKPSKKRNLNCILEALKGRIDGLQKLRTLNCQEYEAQ